MFHVLSRCSLALLAAVCLLPSAVCPAADRISFSIHDATPPIAQGRRGPVAFSIHARDEQTAAKSKLIAFSVHDARPLDTELADTDTDDEDEGADVSDRCRCGCDKPGCQCLSQCRKPSAVATTKRDRPVVHMKSASWCNICPTAKKALEAEKNLPFDIKVDVDEASTVSLPYFTWEVDGRWLTPVHPGTNQIRPGWFGVKDLVDHWKSTQPKTSQQATNQPVAKPRAPAQGQPVSFASPLENRIASIAQATIRSPPPQMVAAANQFASAGNMTSAQKKAKKKPSTLCGNGKTTNASV